MKGCVQRTSLYLFMISPMSRTWQSTKFRTLPCYPVALIKCQGSVYRGCANLLARAAGRPVLPGAEVPYVD